ncbi:MAG TPA: hypothetical protein VF254_06850 [Gammaproteobacteria bacterium]
MTSCKLRNLALAAALLAPDCRAAVPPLDTVTLRAGGFVTQFDLMIHRDDDDGSSIDLDSELGLEEHTLIESVGLAWQPWPRHEFGIEYFNQSLAGTRQLGRELVFEDETFPVATTVYSRFALESFEFHYTWWLFANDEWALGPRFGYADYRMNNRVELVLSEQGEPPAVRIAATWEDHMPAPTVGIDFRYVPAPGWRVSANAGWFKAEIGEVSPIVASARAGVGYFFSDELGVWLDYGLSHLDVDIESGGFDGQVEIYEGGLRLGLVWRM